MVFGEALDFMYQKLVLKWGMISDKTRVPLTVVYVPIIGTFMLNDYEVYGFEILHLYH